ncbi:peptide chain release factor 1 [Candidatus Babeliales bacterium]|nr:peptide chain release factor 1 [Candidatus Babeliales bacterium]MBP9844261.1 peptide chain release factor 1 [Candidatus Babeliales bacterium]
MFDQWGELSQLHEQLNQELSSENLESSRRVKVQKKLSVISAVLEKKAEIDRTQKMIQEAQDQEKQSADAELASMFADEVKELGLTLVSLESELDYLLYPAEELADRSVFLEIRAGTGGQEAALFAADLLKMYTHYAAHRGWRIEMITESHTDLGGFKEVIVNITGKNVFGALRRESGVHRVQRVPATETQGRVHTSTATVVALPEAKEVDLVINDADLRIDYFRSSGAGGQHVNTTDSAVRITHIPTGTVVSCQDERSQHKNKATGMKVLRSRILAAQQEKQQQEDSKNRKSLIGSGDRSEKIRTYNYPQNRVTDHQVEITLKKLDMVMLGELDEIIEALQMLDRQNRQAQSSLLEPI